MENIIEAGKLISRAKTICIIPDENGGDVNSACALALFYTLRELNKNVNLITEKFPDRLGFLIPSLDFISLPKNFVISIPQNTADITQIYYEKSEDGLKIHLTLGKGNIKKNDLSFYYSESKPDLIITLGINDFKKHLLENLNSYGFLLDSPILNIDKSSENTLYGAINLADGALMSEKVKKIIDVLGENLIDANISGSLLSALILETDNFRGESQYETFEAASYLIKKGASHQQIVKNIYGSQNQQINFLSAVFKNLENSEGSFFSVLRSDDFHHFGFREAEIAANQLKNNFLFENLLVLWQSHASEPKIKGLYLSREKDRLSKLLSLGGTLRENWTFLDLNTNNMEEAKEQVLRTLEN